MDIRIMSPSGGNIANVDSDNRLSTKSVTKTIVQDASENGNAFNLNTGIVNLTSSSESHICFMKNDTIDILEISTIGFLMGNSTGGTGDLILRVYRNPTQGTLVTNSVPVDIFENKNTGSTKTYPTTQLPRYKGIEGDTITNGLLWYESLLPSAARTYFINTGSLVIDKGGSISVSVTPQNSNTSMNISIFFSMIANGL